MKLSAALYLVLGVLALAAAVLVPVIVSGGGTPALPLWAAAVSPGPLSAAHAFLANRCESCHTPARGIEPVSCITCHAPDAAILAKQSTAFHATVGTCRDCHAEHRGAGVRPIAMDHAVLTARGLDLAEGSSDRLPALAGAAEVRRYLAAARGRATDAGLLDCAGCHSFRDKHQGRFGGQCADCHATETWKIAGYLHPSPRSEECNQCHQAPPSHYMMHFAMMDQGATGQRGARVQQCYACHQTDAFNDIKGVGWFKMH